jgi:hypothetical protein
MTSGLSKGYLMEELLRRYFIKNGYFTVRGVPFGYQGFEVTDIDIWLYDRPSSIARHRVVVDSKNRNTPKAIERIFWTKGLQKVLNIEQAIVATTDKRPAVAEFGKEHDVLVLDGVFLSKLEKSSEDFQKRLTEEQFLESLSSYKPTKDGGDWKGRFKAAKRPLTNLGYNAINLWSFEAKYFAEQAQLVSTHREIACRILYLLLAFICIAFDFVNKDLAFSDATTKLELINDGLRHGSQGPRGTKQLLQVATGLIEKYAVESRGLVFKIRDRLSADLESIPSRMLAEYFAKGSVSQELFNVAKELENAAYCAKFVSISELSSHARGVFGVFLDFWEIDRTNFFRSFESGFLPLNGTTVSVHPSEQSAAKETKTGQAELPGLKK